MSNTIYILQEEKEVLNESNGNSYESIVDLPDISILNEGVDIKAGISKMIEMILEIINKIKKFINDKILSRFNIFSKMMDGTKEQIKETQKQMPKNETVTTHMTIGVVYDRSYAIAYLMKCQIAKFDESLKEYEHQLHEDIVSTYSESHSSTWYIHNIEPDKLIDSYTKTKECIVKVNELISKCESNVKFIKNANDEANHNHEDIIRYRKTIEYASKVISFYNRELSEIESVWNKLLSYGNVKGDIRDNKNDIQHETTTYILNDESEVLQEGIIGAIGNAFHVVQSIAEKITEPKKETKLENHKEIKEVLKSDLIKEREDFDKTFYKILHKYPKLLKQFVKAEKILVNKFMPEYEYGKIYGFIYGDDGRHISDELEGIHNQFRDEIQQISLKYHHSYSGYDVANINNMNVDIFEYYLDSKSSYVGVDKISESRSTQHETTTYILQEQKETLNEGAIGDFVKKMKDKFTHKENPSPNSHNDLHEYIIPKAIIEKELNELYDFLMDEAKKYRQNHSGEVHFFTHAVSAEMIKELQENYCCHIFSTIADNHIELGQKETEHFHIYRTTYTWDAHKDKIVTAYVIEPNVRFIVEGSNETTHESTTYILQNGTEALNEGAIGDFVKKMKDKISHYVYEKQIAKERKIKDEKPVKEVLKSELNKEREDFKKLFYKTLHKYPQLVKKFEKEDEIYQDDFSPEYDYNIVYGGIYGDLDDGDEFSDDLEKIRDKFDTELDTLSHSLKYHELNIECQGYYFYQLYNPSFGNKAHYKIVGVDKLSESNKVTLNESSYIFW